MPLSTMPDSYRRRRACRSRRISWVFRATVRAGFLRDPREPPGPPRSAGKPPRRGAPSPCPRSPGGRPPGQPWRAAGCGKPSTRRGMGLRRGGICREEGGQLVEPAVADGPDLGALQAGHREPLRAARGPDGRASAAHAPRFRDLVMSIALCPVSMGASHSAGGRPLRPRGCRCRAASWRGAPAAGRRGESVQADRDRGWRGRDYCGVTPGGVPAAAAVLLSRARTQVSTRS